MYIIALSKTLRNRLRATYSVLVGVKPRFSAHLRWVRTSETRNFAAF